MSPVLHHKLQFLALSALVEALWVSSRVRAEAQPKRLGFFSIYKICGPQKKICDICHSEAAISLSVIISRKCIFPAGNIMSFFLLTEKNSSHIFFYPFFCFGKSRLVLWLSRCEQYCNENWCVDTSVPQRSSIARPYDRSSFSFLRNIRTDVHSG